MVPMTACRGDSGNNFVIKHVIQHPNRLISPILQRSCPKSHNTPFRTEIGIFLYFCSERCILGYGTGSLWGVLDWSVALTSCEHFGRIIANRGKVLGIINSDLLRHLKLYLYRRNMYNHVDISFILHDQYWRSYRKTSSISRTKSQSLNVSCILLHLSSLNPLKPCVKLRMKM